MTNTSLARIDSWIDAVSEVTHIPVTGKRHGHGGLAWSMPSLAEKNLRQPQDGAVDTRTRLATINSHLHSDVLHEPEDARLTGGTRSLTRRLLGLNIIAARRKSPEVVTEHTTGSQVA